MIQNLPDRWKVFIFTPKTILIIIKVTQSSLAVKFNHIWSFLFPHLDSSAVAALQLILRNLHRMWSPELWVPLRKSLPPPRAMIVMVLTLHLWIPPAHLHLKAPRLLSQPVKASDFFAGHATLPRLNERDRPSRPPALMLCSSFNIRRRLQQTPTGLMKRCHPHVHPPVM